MRLKLKSRGLIPKLLIYNFSVSFTICLILYLGNAIWNRLDYQALDFFYRYNINNRDFLKKTNDVILLNITSESYQYFGSNILKRESLAELNNILSELSPEAVMYDMIFATKGEEYGDSSFENSLNGFEKIYLPVGISITKEKIPFKWVKANFYDRLKTEFGKPPIELNKGKPFYSNRAVVQLDRFNSKSTNSGHLSVNADPDGVFRHVPLVIKIDSIIFPSISLTMFLDYIEVPIDSLYIKWGEYIKINMNASRYVDNEILIPIDENGQTYIPYPSMWQQYPRMMEGHNLIKYYNDPDMQGDLLSYFEGKFVIIGDVSEGISDLGQTQLEDNVPLVLIHASMLSAFLTNGFFFKASAFLTFLPLFLLGVLLSFASILKSNLPFYAIGSLSLILILILGNYFLSVLILLPIATLFIGASTISLGTLLMLQILSNQEQIFIKNAFSKYVPGKVVDKLLDNPSQLQLGGEERLVSILFSDVKDFTKISEEITPAKLGKLIHEYLTAMTKIVLRNGGIIDKYIGDGILAEFGVPIFTEDHAEQALKSALEMQQILPELNDKWLTEDLPPLSIRIGINTGRVIAGNMGSEQVFDYTVIGDSVNLASRLEGANKLYGSKILISEFTLQYIIREKYQIRALDKLKVKGKSQAVIVYEVLGLCDNPITDEKQLYYKQYEEAFNLFLNEEFSACLKKLEEILRTNGEDLATKNLMTKINKTNIS